MDKQLFLDIYQEFDSKKQLFIDKGVKPIELIDRYRGQPLNPEQYEFYPLPALFIDRAVVWTREGQVYNGALALGFHLVTEPTWDTSNISTNREAGLDYFTLVDCVREVLDNMRRPYISAMLRTDDAPIDTGVVMYERLGYTCIYYGTTNVEPNYPDSVYHPDASLVMDGKLQKKINTTQL